MSYDTKTKIPTWVYIALVALLGLNGYQWFTGNAQKKEFKVQEAALFEQQKTSATLESDYEAAMASLEELRSDNMAANELIDSQKKELESQKKNINNLIWKSRELKKAKEEILSLNHNVTAYISEINTLKRENATLKENNTQLVAQNTTLQTDLSNEKEVASKLAEDKVMLQEQKEKINSENKVYGRQVDMASAIKLNSLVVEGRQDKGEGKSKEQKKVKKLNFLRTCIKTETNMVVKPGVQDIYIRIVSPLGETLYREDLGSGILTDKLSGEQIKYTLKGTIDYQNDDHEACFDWSPEMRLDKGNYTVNAYHRDYEVGKGDFKLK